MTSIALNGNDLVNSCFPEPTHYTRSYSLSATRARQRAPASRDRPSLHHCPLSTRCLTPHARSPSLDECMSASMHCAFLILHVQKQRPQRGQFPQGQAADHWQNQCLTPVLLTPGPVGFTPYGHSSKSVLASSFELLPKPTVCSFEYT